MLWAEKSIRERIALRGAAHLQSGHDTGIRQAPKKNVLPLHQPNQPIDDVLARSLIYRRQDIAGLKDHELAEDKGLLAVDDLSRLPRHLRRAVREIPDDIIRVQKGGCRAQRSFSSRLQSAVTASSQAFSRASRSSS